MQVISKLDEQVRLRALLLMCFLSIQTNGYIGHMAFACMCAIRLMTKLTIENHITFNFLTRYQEVVDESIKLVMKKRQVKSQVRGLTEQDLFFREVCFIHANQYACISRIAQVVMYSEYM